MSEQCTVYGEDKGRGGAWRGGGGEETGGGGGGVILWFNILGCNVIVILWYVDQLKQNLTLK